MSGIKIIAEIGLAHEGSLGLACKHIDVAKSCGADAVKFQTHFGDFESSLDEKFRIKFSAQDRSRYDYWRRTEFNVDEWGYLFDYCKSHNIEFISSPFSVEAAELLLKLGVKTIKIASGEIFNTPMLDVLQSSNVDLIFSSGLANRALLEEVIARFSSSHRKIQLLHCVSKYPCPAEDAGLNLISELQDHFAHIVDGVGLSDHSGLLAPSILAVGYDISILEVHLCLSDLMFGPDVIASHDPSSFRRLVNEVRHAERCVRNPLTLEKKSASAKEYAQLFGRSLAFAGDYPAGHVVNESDLIYLKPGGGIPYQDRGKVVSKTLAKGVLRRERCSWEHFKD